MNNQNWQYTYEAKKTLPLRPFNIPVLKSDSLKPLIKENINNNKNILHFGCGKEDINIPGIKTYKLDIDEEITVDYRKIEDIPEKIEFDILFIHNTIEHLTVNEIKILFNWANKRCKCVMINIPNPWASYGIYSSDYTHKTFLNHRAYGGLLKETNFSTIKLYRLHTGFYHPIRDKIADIIGIDYVQTIGIIAKK